MAHKKKCPGYGENPCGKLIQLSSQRCYSCAQRHRWGWEDRKTEPRIKIEVEKTTTNGVIEIAVPAENLHLRKVGGWIVVKAKSLKFL